MINFFQKRYPLIIVAVLGWGLAIVAFGAEYGVDHEAIKSFLGEAASNQITQAGFFFTMAAWLHSGRVKKEIKSNFENLTEALNNVAASLRDDLKNHSGRLDNLSMRVQNVENSLIINKRT